MRLIVLGCGGRERFSSLPQTRLSVAVAVIEILAAEPKLQNKNVNMIIKECRYLRRLRFKSTCVHFTLTLPLHVYSLVQGLVKGVELCLNPNFFGWLEK